MAASLATIALFSQCTKPTLVGADILDQDQSDLVRSDSFTVLTRSIPWDTVITYDPDGGASLTRYPLGGIMDPLLGNSSTTVYFELLPSYGFSEPDFTNAVLDSIVLTLHIDTTRILGTPVSSTNLDVFRLMENIPDEELTTQRSLTLSSSPLGTYSGPIWPAPVSTSVDYVGAIDTQTLAHVRIPLDLALGMELMALDSATLVSDSAFIQVLNGFGVRFRDPINAYAGFYIQSSNTALNLYYSVDTLHYQAKWVPSSTESKKHYAYDIDRSGVTYPDLLANNTAADSVHVIQGVNGFDLEVNFPHLPQQEPVLVNLAMLELTVCYLDGATSNPFGPPAQLEIYTYEDDRLILVDDVVFALGSGVFGLENYFGGVPLTLDNQRTTYRFNLSAQVQKIILGEASPTLYVRVRQRESYPTQSFICGASSPDGAPKLTITYSRLNP